MYLLEGRAKRAARAFGFPLVAERASAKSHRVWGRSPASGNVKIQRRTGTRWRTVRTVKATRAGTFFLRVARKPANE